MNLHKNNKEFFNDSKEFLPEVYFVAGKYRKRVRDYVLRFGMLQYVCANCGLGPQWCKTKLVLELDHIDGSNLNNELSNLRFLCPNCHSQTTTYKSKNRKAKKDPNTASIRKKNYTEKKLA